MATILGVSDGELIRTSWGDAVADELNTNTVKKSGAQTMAGPLTVADAIVANNHVQISDAPTAGNHATRKDYVDTEVAAVAAAAVSTTGDTIIGTLYVGPDSSSDPFAGQTGIALTSNAAVGVHRSTAGINVNLFKSAAAAADGQSYVGFFGATTATVLGSISRASASSVAYNTSSDYRLKDELGPVTDPVDRLMQLQPKHLRWKSDGSEFDGFIAHEVDEVVPEAVTGEKDAMVDGNIAPQMLDTKALIPLLTAALQDAHTQIDALTARLDALEAA